MCAALSNLQNPDGSYSLVALPTQTDLAQCQLVVQSGSEAANGQLLLLTPSDAAVISIQICSIWALAWGFKQLSNLMKVDNHVEEN